MNKYLLVGKTISAIQKMKPVNYDDTGYLKIMFTDGSTCYIVAGYSSYTGQSEDEYPTTIGIYNQCKQELEVVK
jgi:hypothetical protein